MSPDLDSSIQSGANEAFAELDLVDLNVILHRADGEEKDATGESRLFHYIACFPSWLRPFPLLAFWHYVIELTRRRRWSLHDPGIRIPRLLRS
jgi:hypothetical protein